MKCTFCGYRFDFKKARVSCKGCSSISSCGLIKCPNCGYEMPPEPKWLKKIFKKRSDNGA